MKRKLRQALIFLSIISTTLSQTTFAEELEDGNIYSENTECVESIEEITEEVICESDSIEFEAAPTITPSEPIWKPDGYHISTAAELYWFAGKVNGTLTDGSSQEVSARGKLVCDITVNSNVLKANGDADSNRSFAAWTPIGADNVVYTGSFDGQGYTISGLYSDKTGTEYCGLFGKSSGTIKNVNIADSFLRGHYVGAIAGSNSGTIENCHNSGTVDVSAVQNASTFFAGGICGDSSGTVIGCSNSGKVVMSGTAVSLRYAIKIGGICGQLSRSAQGNTPVISKCSNTHTIYGAYLKDSDPIYLGGICGFDKDGGIIQSCFNYGIISFSGPEAGGIIGKTHADTVIKDSVFNLDKYNGSKTDGISKTEDEFSSGAVCYALNGGDEQANPPIWYQTLGTDSLPVLDKTHGTVILKGDSYKNAGEPDVEDGFYLIGTLDELRWFSNKVNGGDTGINGKLTADIIDNLEYIGGGSFVGDHSDFDKWTPIGTASNAYNGIFDGQGHSVRGLYISDPYGIGGFFGQLNANGIIKNVTIKDSSFYSTKSGGICAKNNGGSIEKCQNYNSKASGGSSSTYCGGICGENIGTIVNCYNAAGIGGIPNNYIGGISGCNKGTISQCFSTGGVNRGLTYIARNSGSLASISNCYFLADEDTTDSMGVSGKSAESLASGAVCSELDLRITDGSQAWYQTIGEDPYPVLDNSRGTVYHKCINESYIYSNTPFCSHTAGDVWKNDDTHHWKECTLCADIINREKHSFEENICSTCGYAKPVEPDPVTPTPEEPPAPSHTHIPDKDWHNDAVSHWHVCSDTSCGKKIDISVHSFTDGICRVCGEKEQNIITGKEIDDTIVSDGQNEYSVVSKPVPIKPCEVNNGNPLPAKTYNGKPFMPTFKIRKDGKILKQGIDYQLYYDGRTDVGKSVVTIKGTGAYNGTETIDFSIKEKALNKLTVVTDDIGVGSLGNGVDPIHIFDGQYELVKDKDYKYTLGKVEKGVNYVTINAVSGSNYIDGTKPFVVKVTGVQINEGQSVINAKDITLLPNSSESAKWTLEENGELSTLYDMTAKIPDVVVTAPGGDAPLIKGQDYTVIYKNNKNAGTAYVIVKAKGKVYKGRAVASFTINPSNAGFSTVMINKNKDIKYNGKVQTPPVVVKVRAANGKEKTLSKNKDYTLRYRRNINHGVGFVTLTGIGNYEGIRRTYIFKINPRDIKAVSKTIKSVDNIKLKYASRILEEGEGKDYVLDIKDAGIPDRKNIEIQGQGNYCGVIKKDNVKIK